LPGLEHAHATFEEAGDGDGLIGRDLACRHRLQCRVEGGDDLAGRALARGNVEMDRAARGFGSKRSRRKRAATASPASALSMTMRARVASSPSRRASFKRVARLRVPVFLPAGLPEDPGKKRPSAPRAMPSWLPSMTHPSLDEESWNHSLYVRKCPVISTR
jgi:hypothetical protein